MSDELREIEVIRNPSAVVRPPKIVPNSPIKAALGLLGNSRTIKTVAITTAAINDSARKNLVIVLTSRIRSVMYQIAL